MVGVGSGRCHFRLRTASFVRRLPDRMVAISAKVVFLDRQRLLRSFLHPLFPKSLLHSFSSTHVCSHLWTSSSIHVSWWRLVQRKVGPRLHQIVLWWRWIESVLEILWLVVWHRNRRHHITLVAPSLRWIEWRRVEWSLLVKQVTLCSRLSVSLITWSCVIGVWIVIVMTVMTVIQFLRFIRSDWNCHRLICGIKWRILRHWWLLKILRLILLHTKLSLIRKSFGLQKLQTSNYTYSIKITI